MCVAEAAAVLRCVKLPSIPPSMFSVSSVVVFDSRAMDELSVRLTDREHPMRVQLIGVAGSGIGLAVVRELVDRQGGSVWVEDAMSGGARLVVELPS